MKIGISYTTRNRPDALEYSLTKVREFLPQGAKVVVIDDNSDSVHRDRNAELSRGFEYAYNEEWLGIPHSKHKAFQLLKDCDYQFWFDDDCYPICEGWHEPFIDEMDKGQKHLLYMRKWLNFKCVKRVDGLEVFNGVTACLMTFHKDTYKDIEGFNEGFGIYGVWHFGLTTKMYDRGHTIWWCATIANPGGYIYSFDLDGVPADCKIQRHRSAYTLAERKKSPEGKRASYEAFTKLIGATYGDCSKRLRKQIKDIEDKHMKIGISYTTRNRLRVFKHALRYLNKFLPTDYKTKVVVIDDNSKPAEARHKEKFCERLGYIDYVYNEERMGVSHSKHKAFQMLKDCDYQFWFDDDTFPVHPNWHTPFIEGMNKGQKHLLFLIEGRLTHIRYFKTIDDLVQFKGATGCLMAFDKSVYGELENFNKNLPMLSDWHFCVTQKIYNQGYSPFGLYVTVKNVRKLICCLDLIRRGGENSPYWPDFDFHEAEPGWGSSITPQDRAFAEGKENLAKADKAEQEFLRYKIGEFPPEVAKCNLNNFALSEECLYWILENIPRGSTIIEIGTGIGTTELCKFYNVVSIECHEKWMLAKDATFIHAPLKDYGDHIWFDVNKIKIPEEYSLIILDALTEQDGGRRGFLHHLDLFRHDVPLIFDDTHRWHEMEVAEEYGRTKNRRVRRYIGHQKHFSVAE